MASWLDALGVRHPILVAPMAGVSTPALAAAATRAGALGSIAVGHLRPDAAAELLAECARSAPGPLNVNVFTHAPPRVDAEREAAWLRSLAPHFAAAGASAPETAATPYEPLDDAMAEVLIDAGVRVVSTHFGIPADGPLRRLKDAGCTVLGTATCLAEARALIAAGVDVIVAQGVEAGGHRGHFDALRDPGLGTLDLVGTLVAAVDVPVVAAGGLMDGTDLRRALDAGACAGQFGTAFVACPESAASPAHRAALGPGARTAITAAISGRPARGLLGAWEAVDATDVPDYPRAYDAGRRLAAAHGPDGAADAHWAVRWAGTGADRARAMPAEDLVATLAGELASA